MTSDSTIHLFAKLESFRSLRARHGDKGKDDSDTQNTLPGMHSANKDTLLGEYSNLDDHEIRESERKHTQDTLSLTWSPDTQSKTSFLTRKVWRVFMRCLYSLLPSFWHPSTRPRRLHKTSYFDGLRGIGGLFVIIHHYSSRFTLAAFYGWYSDQNWDHLWFFQLPIIHVAHFEGERDHNWFLQLPIIRVVHSGAFMVRIFFLLSGYVLSHRGLKLAREGKQLALLDWLARSVFRRWLRIFLPMIASTFTGFLLTRANLWRNLPEDYEPAPPLWTAPPLPAPEGTFAMQFLDWFADTAKLCDPFLYGAMTFSKYNLTILWTMPVEWINSIVVFVTVLAIARTKTMVKITTLSILICWCHQKNRWEPAMFLCGVLLAEISLIRADLESKSHHISNKIHSFASLGPYLFWTSLFIFGVYIGSVPYAPASCRGYRSLMKYVPEKYQSDSTDGYNILNSIGSFLVVFSLENATYLQSIFNTRFALYLGDIGFSLYLLHTQILYTLGQWIVPKCMAITGGWANGQAGFVSGMGIASLAFVPLTFWVSDVFARVVDKNCDIFSRWVTEKCFVKA